MGRSNHIIVSYRIPISSGLLVKEVDEIYERIVMGCNCKQQKMRYCGDCGTRSTVMQESYKKTQLSELGTLICNGNLEIRDEKLVDADGTPIYISENDIITNYKNVPYYYVSLEKHDTNDMDISISMDYQLKVRDEIIHEISQYSFFTESELDELRNKFDIRIKFYQSW